MTTTLVHLKHGYDQASNRLYRRDEVARTNSGSFDELYAYDGLHRLTSFDRGQLNSGNTALSSGPTLNQSWTLDSTGNWKGFTQTVQNALTQTRTHNEVNEIDGISKTVGADWPTPAFDDNGNMTNFPQPLALTDSYTAVYDAWNRLVRLTNDADDDKTVAEFEYDGLNRRTVKDVYDDGSLDSTRHYYFSDQWQVLEERVDSDTSADRQYVWGLRYVDDLVLRDHSSTRLYALTDALFNVVALTDDTGDVKERFAYQPYGESEPLNPNFSSYSGTNYEWEYRFTGRELDLESGLQLNRNRYLHQQLGRWVTRDPIAIVNRENLYSYAGLNAIILSDPRGTDEENPCSKYFDWSPDLCNDCPPCTFEDVHGTGTLGPNFPLAKFLGKRLLKEMEITCEVHFKIGDCGFRTPSAGVTCATGTERNKREIYICIQERTSRGDVEELLRHELIHARQLCRQQSGSDKLEGECEKNEREAYEVSCRRRLSQECILPGDDGYSSQFRECVDQGINFSCKTAPTDVTKTCDDIIKDVFGQKKELK